MSQSELLKSSAAAKFLDVSETTLWRLRGRNDGPAWIKISANVVRYRKSDLEDYIKMHTKRRSDES